LIISHICQQQVKHLKQQLLACETERTELANQVQSAKEQLNTAFEKQNELVASEISLKLKCDQLLQENQINLDQSERLQHLLTLSEAQYSDSKLEILLIRNEFEKEMREVVARHGEIELSLSVKCEEQAQKHIHSRFQLRSIVSEQQTSITSLIEENSSLREENEMLAMQSEDKDSDRMTNLEKQLSKELAIVTASYHDDIATFEVSKSIISELEKKIVDLSEHKRRLTELSEMSNQFQKASENEIDRLKQQIESLISESNSKDLFLEDLQSNYVDEIDRIELTTHESAIRIISKKGPLHNPADRDHCLQYMVAIGLLFGDLKV
jgi:hypothetical protein